MSWHMFILHSSLYLICVIFGVSAIKIVKIRLPVPSYLSVCQQVKVPEQQNGHFVLLGRTAHYK